MFNAIRERIAGVGIPGVVRNGKLKTLQMADVMVPATITCKAGIWERVGKYTVKPQTTQRWGYGREGVPQSNIGIFQFVPKISPTDLITGGVRLAIYDSEDRLRDIIIHNVRTERLAKDLSDGKDFVFFLPEQGIVAREDDYLSLEICGDGVTTVELSKTASVLRVDTTIYI